MWARKRKRMRELDVSLLEKMRDGLDMQWKEIELLMGISSTQRRRYQACGRMPASHYYALKDALLLDVEQRADEERKRILKLLGMDDNDDVMDKQ